MKAILTPILVALFSVGGVAGGYALKSAPDTTASKTAKKDKAKDKKKSEKKDDKGKKKDKKKDSKKSKGKKDKAKKDKGAKDKGDKSKVSIMKFKRQFVVPVVKRKRIDALVIMNINLELNDEAPDNIYILQPKLRDAITRELLALSDSDVFGEGLTSIESYQKIQDSLLRACQNVVPYGLETILILDLARQDQ